VLIDQVDSFSVDPAIAEILRGADGAVDPTFVSVGSQAPRLAFSTTALATVLAKCGISGLAIAADVDEAGLIAWFQKLQEGGTRATGTVHKKMTVAKGLLLPRRISAQQGGDAELSMEVLTVHDGTNNPIVLASNQALSGSPSVSELFTVGPVVINGVRLEGIQSVDIDFGIQEIIRSADGGIWPTFVAIRERRPRIRITTDDAAVLNTFGLSGAAQGATDSVVYLRKRLEGGGLVEDATEEHISFSVAEGMIVCGPLSARHPDIVGAEVILTPTYDGSNAILAVDVTAAVSLP
jgi:hypothetical protein